MTVNQPFLMLNDGARIPQLGLGTMYISPEDLSTVMADAVEFGYRHFDTATHYQNEVGVGEGIRRLDMPRGQLFITTKLPNVSHGYDEALRAFDASERAIGKIDLYLVHWPQPPKKKYRDCWRALVRLRNEGRVRSIGVSNFTEVLIKEIIGETGVAPAVNQIQVHPRYQQKDLCAFNKGLGIAVESWSPLDHGRALKLPVVEEIAARIGRTPAQVVLRWHLQKGLVVIAKAAKRPHLTGNLEAYKFELTDKDMAEIDALECGVEARMGPDPMVNIMTPPPPPFLSR